MNPRTRRKRRARRRERPGNTLWIVWCVRNPGPKFKDFYRVRRAHPNHAVKDKRVELRYYRETASVYGPQP